MNTAYVAAPKRLTVEDAQKALLSIPDWKVTSLTPEEIKMAIELAYQLMRHERHKTLALSRSDFAGRQVLLHVASEMLDECRAMVEKFNPHIKLKEW